MSEQRYFVDERAGRIAVIDRIGTPRIARRWEGVLVNGGWVISEKLREIANGACCEMNAKAEGGQ